MRKPTRNPLLVTREAPVLREIARPLTPEEIGSKKVATIVSKMKKALHAEEDGVAIAAPQIGVGLKIFVVAGQAIVLSQKKEVDPEKVVEDKVFFNPEIIKVSKTKKKMEEGCLSVRWLYGEVLRHDKVTLKALDESGKPVTVRTSGLLAQIFQHETDHLEGVLFIDKAENVRDMPPENSHD